MSGLPGGTDLPSGLRSLSVTIDTSEIASPHDFGFQLRHYVVAPEAREGEKLVEIVRLGSGGLVKIDIVSAGTVDEPKHELTVFSADPLTPSDVGEARRLVAWREHWRSRNGDLAKMISWLPGLPSGACARTTRASAARRQRRHRRCMP